MPLKMQVIWIISMQPLLFFIFENTNPPPKHTQNSILAL